MSARKVLIVLGLTAITSAAGASGEPAVDAKAAFERLKALQGTCESTSLASADAGHMRRARYQQIDANHFVTEWEYYENGKPKLTETERFTRVR